MKKYVKPELFYERYELTEQIAACAWDMNSQERACSATGSGGFTDWVIFTDGIDDCKLKVESGTSGNEIYCYYPQESGKSTFNS